VSPRCQRKGYGGQLIEAGCDRGRNLGHQRIALLIEVDDAAAKPLYERLGFCTDYTKRIVGQEYFHMVEFVMYQGTRAVLQSGKNFQVPAMIADVGPGPRVAVVVSVVEICRRLKIAPATTSVRYFLGGGPRSTKSSKAPGELVRPETKHSSSGTAVNRVLGEMNNEEQAPVSQSMRLL